MHSLTRMAAARRELAAAGHIPYAAHVAPHVVRTDFGDYLQTFRLGGASFETNDDDELNNWHERLNVLWRNIAAPTIALWTHVIRRGAQIRGSEVVDACGTAAPEGRCAGFADRLHSQYTHRIGGATLLQNDLYLSILYRPAAGLAADWRRAKCPAALRQAGEVLCCVENLRSSSQQELALGGMRLLPSKRPTQCNDRPSIGCWAICFMLGDIDGHGAWVLAAISLAATKGVSTHPTR